MNNFSMPTNIHYFGLACISMVIGTDYSLIMVYCLSYCDFNWLILP